MNSAASEIDTEGVIVISDSVSPEHIIERILDVEVLPASVSYSDNIKGYPWKFETKYYSAEVNLYAIIDKTPFKKDFADSIKASVVYFDSSKESSFEDILKWIMIYDNIQPEVRILVCNNFSKEFPALLRKDIIYWCAKNQFELVELNPLEEENDEDELIPESKGYARIVQSLQAHTWENLIMKSRTSACRNEKQSFDDSEEQKNAENALSDTESKEDRNGATVACGKNRSTEENVRTVKVGNDELSLEENWINNVVSGDDPDGESFEALFSKFASMKERAEGLTGESRKRYAEEVAIAFWKAMGGDEDEIEGLDD